METGLFELTRRLIAIESITGNEAAVADFLYEHLLAIGWRSEKIQVSPTRWNVFARRGKPAITFSTHIDTVPPFLDPWEDDDFIYGRGACDAKGPLAAQIFAAEELFNEGLDLIGLLFVVGEEQDSIGAITANRWLREQPFAEELRYLINAEPTENRLASGTKGALRLRIETRGRAAHSAYPHLGENAIDKLLGALERIHKLPRHWDPVLGEQTINIGTISGGIKPNIISDKAQAEVMFRLVTDPETVKQQVLDEVSPFADVRFDFEIPAVHLKIHPGFDTAPMSFYTDIPSLHHWGEPLLLGPGSIHDAHTMKEKISKKDLVKGQKLYVQLARELLDNIDGLDGRQR